MNLISTEKHTSHDTRAKNSKISGNNKSVIIVGGSLTNLLNSWGMAKKIQSNCRKYGRLDETVLKKPPRSFHFACWDERSIL